MPERQLSTSPLTASLLTPPGRGAVAVIRVHTADSDSSVSNQAVAAVESCFVSISGTSLSEQPVGRLCYGHWVSSFSSEDVVVCRTDEASVEVSCHGGRAAVNRILDSLCSAGASTVDWQTQQATIDSAFESELTNAVSQATTARTTALLLGQASGTLHASLSQMLQLDSEELTSRLSEMLAWSQFGLHLTQPWKIVLAGRPNVGKSTLINALLGYTRAVVYDQPGTTRDVVTGQTAFDGWPFQLADTAGIRNTKDELEQAGIERARRTVESADLVCVLLDTSHPPTAEDQELLTELASPPAENRPPAIVIAHKVDQPDQWADAMPDNAVHVSSTTGTGIEEFIHRIVQTLIPTVPSPETAIPISRRQINWLNEAHRAAQKSDLEFATHCIQSCLSGVAFSEQRS